VTAIAFTPGRPSVEFDALPGSGAPLPQPAKASPTRSGSRRADANHTPRRHCPPEPECGASDRGNAGWSGLDDGTAATLRGWCRTVLGDLSKMDQAHDWDPDLPVALQSLRTRLGEARLSELDAAGAALSGEAAFHLLSSRVEELLGPPSG
jgi:hypothetical protein